MISIIIAQIFWGTIQGQWKNGANAHGTKQGVQTDAPTYGPCSLWGEKYPLEVEVPFLGKGESNFPFWSVEQFARKMAA